jgi:hypothetical protein
MSNIVMDDMKQRKILFVDALRSAYKIINRSRHSAPTPNGSSARSRAYGGAAPSPWYHVQRNATAPHHRTRQTSNSFTGKELT